MPAESSQRTFRLGLDYLRHNHLPEAANAFRCLFKEAPENPLYMSYYGLILALFERNYQDGINFCRAAILLAVCESELYVNLSRVYSKAGQRKKALEALVEGLKYAANKTQLLGEMKRLGYRRRPVLPFLPRDHFLNKSLGKLTHRLRRAQASARYH
jgi:predicted Zn-dependent protease